jgi:hypothetical protein
VYATEGENKRDVNRIVDDLYHGALETQKLLTEKEYDDYNWSAIWYYHCTGCQESDDIDVTSIIAGLKPHWTREVENTYPITRQQVGERVQQIEKLFGELGSALRWAKERRYCVGDGWETAEEYEDSLSTTLGVELGRYGECTCGRCPETPDTER